MNRDASYGTGGVGIKGMNSDQPKTKKTAPSIGRRLVNRYFRRTLFPENLRLLFLSNIQAYRLLPSVMPALILHGCKTGLFSRPPFSFRTHAVFVAICTGVLPFREGWGTRSSNIHAESGRFR